MQFNFFYDVESEEQAKEKYKNLSMQFHPDHEGGDAEIMTQINLEYAELKKLMAEKKWKSKEVEPLPNFEPLVMPKFKLKKKDKERLIKAGANFVGTVAEITASTAAESFLKSFLKKY